MKHTQEELLAMIEPPLVEAAIDRLIQNEILVYNKANGVSFKDINAVVKYATIDTYTHVGFCKSMLTWNAEVWEASRKIQSEIYSGTIEKPESVEAFISLLPKRVV